MSQITDQVKERIDIIELVREYVPALKKAGANWKACCPFHQEKTPSFMVSENKQIWHCFGCGKGGDVFGFIREIEGLEFIDALRILAKRAGIVLQKQDPKLESERTRTLDILRIASAWYHQALKTAKSADKARAYVSERKIKDEMRDLWQLGFAPDAWEGVSVYLHSKGYRNEEIARAGLSSQNNKGGYYDRFRNRLMFPISDVHGNIVGFTARKMSEDGLGNKGAASIGGKYINTPETSVYHKSSVLYGLSRTKQEIREQDLAVVVEGNMDCISSYQAGVKNVVASSGTALTPEQVRLLKRFTKNISLAFDPDKAGQEAMMRGLQIAWQEEMRIKIIALPEGKDPDDLIKEDVSKWKSAIKEARDFMDWIIQKSEKDNDIFSAHGKKKAAKIILAWIARLPDPIEQTHYLQILSDKINVDEAILRSAIKSQPFSRSDRLPHPAQEQKLSPKKNIENRIGMRILSLLLLNRDMFGFSVDWLPDSHLQNLYKNIISYYDSHIDIDMNLWLESLDNSEKPLAREIVLIAEELSKLSDEERAKELEDLAHRLKKSYLKKRLQHIRSQMKLAESSGSLDKVQECILQWQEINKELQD